MIILQYDLTMSARLIGQEIGQYIAHEAEMTDDLFYTKVSEMEPMMPANSPMLEELAVEVIRKSAALGGVLHAVTRTSVVALVRTMNSYYSNLIEGHHTNPVDIENALANDYSHDPAKRALQLESAAHVHVQREMEERLAHDPTLDICGADFLCWLHQEFYERLPEEFLEVEFKGGKKKVIAGALREDEVTVGRHLAPHSSQLPAFLNRFSASYRNPALGSVAQVIAAAASHHRLAWIHPFLDGNGRVTRLFTHAFLLRAGVDGYGMWTVSRGLARNRDAYMSALARADHHRQGDLDGRGNLSLQGLVSFCRFFLETSIDQISFMNQLLDLDGMKKRISAYVARQADFGHLQKNSGYLLEAALIHGKLPRGEAARILNMPERSARRVLKELLKQKLLASDTAKGPVRLAFPAKVSAYYFPRLYPAGVEAEL